MESGLLHLHNLLRWIILILLVWNIIRHVTSRRELFGRKDVSLGKWLLYSAHLMLLIGLTQYFTRDNGFKLFQTYGSEVMSNSVYRYWAVEHITGMIIAVILITIAYGTRKKSIMTDQRKHKRALTYYVIALLIILVNMPWPFRMNGIARGLFPGME